MNRARVPGRLVLLAIALICGTVHGAQASWSRIETPHFEMFTATPENEAKQALAVLESARVYFEGVEGLSFRAEGKVRVIAFESEQEYSKFALHSNSFAYFLSSHGRDYIVLRDIRREHQQALIHEYTHYVTRRAKLSLPLWLNEGLADYYSSLSVADGLASVGTPLDSRMGTLNEQKWMPLSEILGATHSSSYMDETATASMFYAESWMLAHMLSSSSSYAGRFPQFMRALAESGDSSKAMTSIYNKTVAEVEADMREYAVKINGAVAITPVKAAEIGNQVSTRTLGDNEREMVMADLLVAQPWTAQDEVKELERLSHRYPAMSEAQELLGFSALQRHDRTEARTRLSHAVELGSKNAEVHYQLARLEREAGMGDQRVLQLLNNALVLNPKHRDAAFDLAILQFNLQAFDKALATLSRVSEPRAEWKFTYDCLMAYCNLHSHDLGRARSFGDLAKEHASSAKEKDQADLLLKQLAALGA